MSRAQTYADILLNLPVDDTLKTFMERHALPLPEGWSWNDSVQTSKGLIGLIQSHPVAAMRDRIVAGLHASTLLAHPLGKQAMFQAAHDRPSELMGLIGCKSDLQRAFWLYVHHPALFEAAAEIEYLDHHGQQAQQHDLGIKRAIQRDEASIAAFSDAIKGFYQRELGCGEVCVVNVLERARGTQLISIHAKDLATAKLEFEGSQLQRRVGSPNIHMVLEYAQATGVARTIIRGGAKYHAMLCEAFARHLLGVDADAQRIQTPRLNLTSLRLGMNIPEAIEDGFVGLQVKSVTVVSGCGRLKLECTASASSDQRCVTDLLASYFNSENPLTRGWMIQAAVLNFYLAPMQGKSRCPVVSVEVTSKGRLNLHKFDEKLRTQLEGYLVQLGILQGQQVLLPDPESAGQGVLAGGLFE
ncbi:hypothetical protein RAE21_09200 [Rhodoferax sp. TBRC 17198]|uniref:hypothetical protein n=1 Tax=Rhodoferax potami TaxID=3068338 RepID=UPI0028BD18E6|nr:hypothetical protein [Rhodoferax sp. TBRC 17198]MDT7522579.1 hypothetical protein [Rhodoferax sp. TBRC 17198]